MFGWTACGPEDEKPSVTCKHREMHPFRWVYAVSAVLVWCRCGGGSRVLMVTMGGTKSHKIPFLELARGLISRGHNVTFLNAFPPDAEEAGLEEITPLNFVFYVRNYTNWDLLGVRMSGREAVPPADVLRYAYHSCDTVLSDPETRQLMNSGRSFDLAILDGAYPECALGLAFHFRAPFMYLNSVAFYMGSVSYGGSPAPFSVTPFFARPFTDDMGFIDRVRNTVYLTGTEIVHSVFISWYLEAMMKNYFGASMPRVFDMAKNVSFILQNGHATVTYPRPYLPNVAEIACIHCRPTKPLPKELEQFVSGSEMGFIYVSMGSSVLTAKMPEVLRMTFLRAFALLPYRVIWKWETPENSVLDLPSNVLLSRWLPQQDILGHNKIRAFVTHGGLLSMFETVYHGVPVVTMPVFCDHDANSAKAVLDGYALMLQLEDLTTEKLVWAINEVIHDPKYREGVRKRSRLLRDQPEHPLNRAIYWTEYVLRHKGAYHLQSPAKEHSVLQYYLIDVIIFCFIAGYICVKLFIKLNSVAIRLLIRFVPNPQSLPEEELTRRKTKLKSEGSGVSGNAGVDFRNGLVASNGDCVAMSANGMKMVNAVRTATSPLKLIQGQAKTLKLH
ncbi:2-hydroxyacylsphingosine 1-beta-galactosyltransferase isoform X2 [Zootermopsis nevadensis]|uniref:2-hydroxyacylsphingosine 1-beta-galactosyltransferase n=1 Tax=Zootermopsis nevadensis TaxID=136037 RepID=A0A067RD76_ZOONE|nr:2-hydroxyacylsphingosine 1-beta-galactosyltransferase isoform X2 [Zootermopsis nevadensis]KDR21702.1 2-hydroxyacylsphingosine 1-beta-galactosyltransferase [Zootermopsis nevadensis]